MPNSDSGTSITVRNGAKMDGTLFGGSENGSVASTNLVIENAMVVNVFGGGGAETGKTAGGTVTGTATVSIRNTVAYGYIYGGSAGTDACAVGAADITINGISFSPAAFKGYIFGGAKNPSCAVGSATLRLEGGSVNTVFGGGYGPVTETNVSVEAAMTVVSSFYAGGIGANGAVQTSNLTVNGGTLYAIYGGGYNGANVTTANMTVLGGTISSGVFAGGYADSADTGVGACTLTISGGTLENVYAGGSRSSGSVKGCVTESATVSLSGNVKVANLYGTGGKRGASTVTPVVSVSGGHFAKDPTDYAAETFYAKEVNEEIDGVVYKYHLEEIHGKPADVKVAVAAEPATADTAGKSQPDAQLMTDAASVISANTETAGLAEIAADKETGKAPTAAEGVRALDNAGLAGAQEADVTIFLRPYLDIAVKDISADGSATTSLTLDIRPMLRIVAATTNKASEIETEAGAGKTKNAAVIAEKPMAITGADPAVTITIQLPEGFATENLKIKHIKEKGKIYFYEAQVSEIAGKKYATFTVTHGFSTFVLSADTRSAAVDFRFNTEPSPAPDGRYTALSVGSALPSDSKRGCSFRGWTFAGVTGGPYLALTDSLMTRLDAVYNAQSEPKPEIVATPSWSLNADVPVPSASYTLTFDVGGGSALPPVYRSKNSTVDLTGYAPTREGYAFGGWYPDAALEAAVTSVKLTKNITVYAKWTKSGSMANFKPNKALYGDGWYTDVPAGAWYGDGNEGCVGTATMLGLVEGYGGRLFGPEDDLKISEAIKLAAAIHSIYMGDGYDFRQGGVWYRAYVDYAIAKGIIKAGDFADYTAVCTREQAAYILARALPEAELAAIKTLAPPDVAKTDKYGAEIRLLYAAGVLRGNDAAGSFGGGGAFTRAQAAAIVTRLCLVSER